MGFKYRQRTAESMEARAAQQGGDFQGFVKDEFRAFKPQPGDNAIRVLPPTFDNADHWGMEIFVHYDVGPDGATILCPYKMIGERCPICEERARAEKRGASDEELRDLKAAKRVLIWLVDLKNEDVGVLYWAMPWTADRDLVKACKDRSTGKYYFIDDPENGYDMYFDKEGEKRRTKYTAWQPAKRASSVEPQWLDYIEEHPLDSILVFRDYEEINKLFRGGSDSNDDEAAAPTSRSNERRSDRAARPTEEDDAPRETSRRARPQEDDDAPVERSNRRRSEPEPEPENDPEPEEEQPRIQRRGRAPENDPPAQTPSSGASAAESLRARLAAARANKK